MRKIAVFASGNGSNAENLIRFFRHEGSAFVSLILTNNPNAGVIKRGKLLGVPVFVLPDGWVSDGEKTGIWLKNNGIDLVVLAGYLKKIPSSLIQFFPEKIINIHPSLLPKFGGKGMYGDKVHQAVMAAGEKESGITVHLVNEIYDDGRIIAQHPISLEGILSAAELAEKIHQLEYRHFPTVVSDYLKQIFPS